MTKENIMEIKTESSVFKLTQSKILDDIKIKDVEKVNNTNEKFNLDIVTLSDVAIQKQQKEIEVKQVVNIDNIKNQQKINELKEQIKNGTFKVDANVIANKLISDKDSLNSLLN